jgi:hypothetical protein
MNTDNFIEYNSNSTNIIKVLLFFYILVGNSLLEPLLSKQWKESVQNSRILKHLIGLTTIFALMILVSDGHMTTVNIILYSLLAYTWFIFSTKMDIHWNIIVVFALLGAYMYDNSVNFKLNNIKNDHVLTISEKSQIINDNNTQKYFIIVGIIILTFIGTFMYSDRKTVQYGGGYSLINFLLY